MGKPIAVVTSDWHLDEHAWADRPGIAGDSKFALQQIVDYAIEHRLELIAAGDLIDKKKNDAGPIGFMRRQLDRLQEANLNFWYLQGQHEMQPSPWLSEIHDWPMWLPDWEASLPSPGKAYRMCGLDWTPRDKIAEALAPFDCADNSPDVLIMHQVMSEFMGSVANPELSVGELPNVAMLIVGDYHVHKSVRGYNRDGGKTEVLSPGSTNMRSIDEPPDKWFYVLNDDLTFTSHRLLTRPYIGYHVSLDQSLDQLVESIATALQESAVVAANLGVPEHLCKPLVRVSFNPGVPDVHRRLTQAVGQLGHLFFKPIEIDVQEAEDEDGETIEQFQETFEQGGLVSLLPRVVDQVMAPDVYKVCERLLTSADPRAALQELREEFLNTEGEADAGDENEDENDHA